MPHSIGYHEGKSAAADEFSARQISDRLEEKLTRTALTDDDKIFFESVQYFCCNG
jgi:hypothetical protein